MTAVEFIIEKLTNSKWEYTPLPERRRIIQEAKDMEKEQIIDARNNGALISVALYNENK